MISRTLPEQPLPRPKMLPVLASASHFNAAATKRRPSCGGSVTQAHQRSPALVERLEGARAEVLVVVVPVQACSGDGKVRARGRTWGGAAGLRHGCAPLLPEEPRGGPHSRAVPQRLPSSRGNDVHSKACA